MVQDLLILQACDLQQVGKEACLSHIVIHMHPSAGPIGICRRAFIGRARSCQITRGVLCDCVTVGIAGHCRPVPIPAPRTQS